MKSLPLLVFAAFAACVPGTRASGYRTLTTLPEELQGAIMANLPETDQASYAAIDRKAHDAAKKRSEILFPIKIQNMFKGLDMPIPMATITSLFNPKKGASVHDQYISISDIINMMGLEKLKGNTQVAKELTSLALPSPGSTKSHLIGDPHGLLLLKREDENEKLKPKDKEPKSEANNKYSIDHLFIQNAEQFKGGLGIGEPWIDNGLLGWYAEGISSRKFPIKITLSHGDVVALLCQSIYSHPKSPGSKVQLTLDEIVEIMQKMGQLLSVLHNQPTLETLRQLKTGPLKTDPVAFDLTVGLEHCIAQRPSVHALIDSLILLAGDKKFAHAQRTSVYRDRILWTFAVITGMDAEDMYWMLCRGKKYPISFSSFKAAISFMCNDTWEVRDSYDCSKSKYFLNTPGNGVLGWDTLSWVLRKMFERRLYQNARQTLLLFMANSLLPAHAPAESEIFKSAIRLLHSTNDGRKLNASDMETLEYLLSGKKLNESQIGQEDNDTESGKGPEKGWTGKMLAKLPGNKKP